VGAALSQVATERRPDDRVAGDVGRGNGNTWKILVSRAGLESPGQRVGAGEFDLRLAFERQDSMTERLGARSRASHRRVRGQLSRQRRIAVLKAVVVHGAS